MSAEPSVHATCVVIGEAGVLIRGPSGSGKSSLAAALLDHGAARGLFARLVADDRVRLEAGHGRLIASAPEAIAGLIERRGLGVTPAPHLPRALVRLVVDIEDAPERMPEPAGRIAELLGLGLPRLCVRRGDSGAADLALDCLELERRAAPCDPNALAFSPRREKISASAWDAPKVRSGRARVARGGLFPERKTFCAETA